MQTEISVIIPQGYWGIVKRWLDRVAKAPQLLGEPQPEVHVDDDAIIYITASRYGRYTFKADKTKLRISFEGRRNSFRSGIPFLTICWHGEYNTANEVDVVLRDVNPFAPEVVFLGHVEGFETSVPEVPFYKVPLEQVAVKPAQI